MPLLSIDNLRTYFHTRNGVVRAVDGVSFEIDAGETLGIVGESGSGKSVMCYSLMGLIPTPPGRIESGAAHFDDRDLLRCSAKELRAIRGKRISMIFQDPMTALNPYMTVGKQLAEPLIVHEGLSRKEARERAIAELDHVGIHDAAQRIDNFPHQFSGGMRQRVMVAMALITRPDLLIADEPTTALDVTVQADLLATIKVIQEELGMAMILITHDLGVIAGVCERVHVMYAGRIVESASTRDLFYGPRHPYTKALMASLPSTQEPGADLYTIPGMPPDMTQEIRGCAFAPRCERAEESCRATDVALERVETCHDTACILEHEAVS
jgi:oligopeptide transport system ATP-binding protein